MLSQYAEKKTSQILSVFETGSKYGDYGNVSIYADGSRLRKDKKQLTFGNHQTTEEGGLKELLSLYCKNAGLLADYFAPFLPIVGVLSLVDDLLFIAALKESANDPIMVTTQDAFFGEYYGKKAKQFFNENGFTCPLSYVVIYDSIIHSGEIRKDIRDSFPSVVPSRGGNEKEWITQYIKARKKWLLGRKLKALNISAYRMDSFSIAIQNDNWDLSKPFFANGELIE